MLTNSLAITSSLINNAAFRRLVLKSVPVLTTFAMESREHQIRELTCLFDRLQKAKKQADFLKEELITIKTELEKAENWSLFRPLQYTDEPTLDLSKQGTSKAAPDTTDDRDKGDGPAVKKRKYDFFINNGYVVVYTDGACENNGSKNARAGIGVWFGPNHPLNVSEPVVGKATNNVAEIQACISAVTIAKEHGLNKLRIFTDSQFVINAMTKWITSWKKKGWKLSNGKQDVKNKFDFEKLDSLCQGIDIQWEHVTGHCGIIGNEHADRLARDGAKFYIPKH